MSKIAFLIQQLGRDNSKERRHADRKKDEIIAPACEREGYTIARADEFSNESISEPITSTLSTAIFVVADLGTPPWNQNVLVEVGFRLASGLPIVFVADLDPKPEQLPVHLRNRRIVHISLERPEDSIERLHNILASQQDRSSTWQSDYPLIELFMPLNGKQQPHFINVNRAAADLYGYETTEELLGTPVPEADEKLQEYMPTRHRKAFTDDQQRLNPFARTPGRMDPVTAKIPAWIYHGHPVKDRLNHVFWPVLLQHKFAKDQGGVVMNVAFIDVTNWEIHSPQHSEPDSVLELPGIFRIPPFDYHVFLSYNSRDAETVRELQKILRRMGLRVWLDEEDLVRTRGVTKDILRSMAHSRAIFAVIGSNGLGPWQEKTELRTMLQDILQEKQPFALLLLDELNDANDPDKWLSYLPLELKLSFKEQPRFFLPKLEDLRRVAAEERSFSDKILRLLVEAIDKPFDS